MLAAQPGQRLFHKAILQSGTNLFHPPQTANRVVMAVLRDLDVAPQAAGRLRDLAATELLEAQTRVTPRAAGIAYRPVADGSVIPTDPFAAVAGGSAREVPLLIGTNLEEQKFFSRLDPEVEQLTDERLLEKLIERGGTAAQAGDGAEFDPAEALTSYRDARAARGQDTSAPELWIAMMSDRRFRVPMMQLAESQSVHCSQTYAYLFTWRSPAWGGRLGAGHAVEVPLVFGTMDVADESGEVVPDVPGVQELSTRMQDAWIAFARTGSPRTQDLPDWEPYSAARRSTMLLGTPCRVVEAPHETERRFWTSATK